MPATTMQDALNAARGGMATADAFACVEALRTTVTDIFTAEVPTVRRVYAQLDQELVGDMTRGAFVLGVLKVPAGTLPASLALVAPKASRTRVLELHADCWLVLSNWVTEWNRRQIRRVA